MKAYPIDSHVTFDEDGIPEYDRAVTSEPLRKLIKSLFKTGIDPTVSTNLQVAADEGMNVIVRPGFACVEGCMALEEDTRVMAVQAASSLYDRIDTVVLRLNDNDAIRECDLYVVEGIPSATPVHPELTREGAIYEIGLADIFVGKNSTRILASKITDTRFDDSRCGVMSSISEFDSSTIYQQVQADLAEFKSGEEHDFSTWFENLVNILDTNAAGHLQNEIEELKQSVNNEITRVGQSINTLSNTKIDRFSDATYTEVTGLAYDRVHKKLGLKVEGADSVIPFSSGAKYIGTYTSPTTVNVSQYGATSSSQFMLVPTETTVIDKGYNGHVKNYGLEVKYYAQVTFTPSSLSLSGNTLTVNLPYMTEAHHNEYRGWSNASPANDEGLIHNDSSPTYIKCKLYYVGDIY